MISNRFPFIYWIISNARQQRATGNFKEVRRADKVWQYPDS